MPSRTNKMYVRNLSPIICKKRTLVPIWNELECLLVGSGSDEIFHFVKSFTSKLNIVCLYSNCSKLGTIFLSICLKCLGSSFRWNSRETALAKTRNWWCRHGSNRRNIWYFKLRSTGKIWGLFVWSA